MLRHRILEKVIEVDKAFKTLKEKLRTTPIIIAPNWSLPFKIMCHASDFSIGAILGQRRGKIFK